MTKHKDEPNRVCLMIGNDAYCILQNEHAPYDFDLVRIGETEKDGDKIVAHGCWHMLAPLIARLELEAHAGVGLACEQEH